MVYSDTDATDLRPRLKVWLEAADAGLALSDYRVRLLELVDEMGSLAEAAERMDLSYRRAWGKVKEIEANLGLRLVESVAGGSGGGHTRLTPEGRTLVERYRRFRARLDAFAERQFAECFGARAVASTTR